MLQGLKVKDPPPEHLSNFRGSESQANSEEQLPGFQNRSPLRTLAHRGFQAPPLPLVEGIAIVFFGFSLLLPTAPNPAKLDSYPQRPSQGAL